MAAIRYLLKPGRFTTFSLAVKIYYLKNNSVTQPKIGTSLLYFIPFSSLSPSYPSSHIICPSKVYSYGLKAIVRSLATLLLLLVNTGNFYLLFSSHKSDVLFAHLLDIPGINNFIWPVWQSSRTKSVLYPVPSSLQERAQNSSDFAAMFPLFCQRLLYSIGKGNAGSLLLMPTAVRARLQVERYWT